MEQIGLTFSFQKSDPTGRYLRGWAYVCSDKHGPVVDYTGSMIQIDTLRDAAHEFISNVRVAKAMHEGQPVGQFVESVIVDDDFAKAMGATTDKRGWWVGMELNDESVRKRVRSGELKDFSIGGVGRRINLPGAAK